MQRKLTPEQRAENKRLSQARWRENKKLLAEQSSLPAITQIEPPPVPDELPTPSQTVPEIQETKPQENIPVSKSEYVSEYVIKDYLGIIFPASLCISITSLLIYFQAQAYSTSNTIEPIDCAVSVVCEISLLYLSGTLRRSFASWFLFLSLFAYNLSVMGFALKREETKKTLAEIKEDPAEIMRKETFEKALVSFDLSAKKKETGNATKILKVMTDLRAETPKEKPPMVQLYEIEAFGLIILRAILMLLNALLIHRILNYTRVTLFTKQGGK